MNKGKVKVEKNNILNKVSELWSRLNKRTALIGLAVIAAIILIIVLISLMFGGKKTLTCTREETVVDFKFKETLVIELKDSDKKDEFYISNLELDKSIEIGDTYNKFEKFSTIVKSQFDSAYDYLDKELYVIKQDGNVTSVKVKISEKDYEKLKKKSKVGLSDHELGLILDNMSIISNSETNKFDLTFNHSKVLESSSTAYKINDKYTTNNLKIKLEGLGYTCK